MGHAAHWTKVDATTPPACPAAPRDPVAFEGFSYLLGTPPEGARSQLGADVAFARQAAGALAAALVREGDASPWTNSLREGVAPDDNPGIPSGYTHLLQFVGHDLVSTDLPFWAAADAGVASRNTRGRGLRLDTLYGNGPNACPVAFAPAGTEDIDRSLLRVGRIAPGGRTGSADPCQWRDLARIHTAAFRRIETDGEDNAVNFDSAFQVIAADARNDASTILAQLTVVFATAHNLLARAVPPSPPGVAFCHARAALLRPYHAIVRTDLLARLLHPAIAAAYAGGAEPLWTGDGLPLEFSHGAMRAGHAMVRLQYDLNDTSGLAKTTAGIVTADRGVADERRPLTDEWIIQWHHFFELGATPNYARRFAARKSALDSALFENHGAAADGTTLRDLLSAALARCWRVDAMIAEIARRRPNLIPADWPFADAAGRGKLLGDWLRTLLGANSDIVDRLAADPPLPLFVQLEAQLDPAVQGRSLGVLGSIIVADVVTRALAEAAAWIAPEQAAAQAALGPLWEQIGQVTTMPALVRFVADHAGLTACGGVPFI